MYMYMYIVHVYLREYIYCCMSNLYMFIHVCACMCTCTHVHMYTLFVYIHCTLSCISSVSFDSVVMDRPRWKNWQLIEELQNPNITIDVVLNHMRTLLAAGSTLLCFTHGNVDKAEVKSFYCLL